MLPSVPTLLELARVVRDAARSVPGVVDLVGRGTPEFATYGRGDRVLGIRIAGTCPPHVGVRVTVGYGARLATVAAALRQRIAAELASLPAVDDARIHVQFAGVIVSELAPQTTPHTRAARPT